jgi:hypothetical protein
MQIINCHTWNVIIPSNTKTCTTYVSSWRWWQVNIWPNKVHCILHLDRQNNASNIENKITKKTRAMQSVVYPLAYKFDPVTLTFDLWPWKSIRFQILLRTKSVPSLVKIHWRILIIVFTRMLQWKFDPVTLTFDLENQ